MAFVCGLYKLGADEDRLVWAREMKKFFFKSNSGIIPLYKKERKQVIKDYEV